MLFRITEPAVVATFIKRNPLCSEINHEAVAHSVYTRRRRGITEITNVKVPGAPTAGKYISVSN